MGYENLSPNLRKFVEAVQKGDGFEVKQLPENTLLELVTKHDHRYTVLVTNPEKGEVVLFGEGVKELREPQLFILQGSTFGGSAVKIGWIGTGLRPRLNPLIGGLVTLSPVKEINFINDPEKAQRIRRQVEASRPPKATEAEIEEAKKNLGKWIEEKFAGGQLEEVKRLVGEFAFPDGQGVILGILDRAREAGKLTQALETLERQLADHWSWRPPMFRGLFINEKDVAYIHQAYQELGLPFPAREGA